MLQINNLEVRAHGHTLFKSEVLKLNAGTIYGVIGENGSEVFEIIGANDKGLLIKLDSTGFETDLPFGIIKMLKEEGRLETVQ